MGLDDHEQAVGSGSGKNAPALDTMRAIEAAGRDAVLIGWLV